MTAIVNDLRPGLGWAALAFAGVLVAGAGLMLAVLPFSERIDIPTDRGDSRIVHTATSNRCATPLANAFRATSPAIDGDRFTGAPGTDPVVGADSCVDPSRRRLGIGAMALLVGTSVAGVAMRRVPAPPPS